jgi:leucyl/phenylalanyl-tRNA--protein transferase
MALHPVWIPDFAPPRAFPDVDWALEEPNGLLAMGGDLSPRRLLYAYRKGIFPWFSTGQPILWWSPDPRMVLFPRELRVSRSLGKRIRRADFEVRVDSAFRDVMRGCAEPRPGQDGTWILPQMLEAYCDLHALGHAHSIECWVDGKLAGGLYGVAMGHVFFGESMFSRAADASKVALHALCQLGFGLVDCQLPTAHLSSLGARLIERARYCRYLDELCEAPLPAPFLLAAPAPPQPGPGAGASRGRRP